MIFLFVIWAMQVQAQNWQIHNLSNDGLPVEASFPQKPFPEKKDEGTTIRYTYNAAGAGLTFTLQATEMKRKGIALPNSVADNSMNTILKGARRSEKAKKCNTDNYYCTESRYISRKNVYTNIRLVVVNDKIYQLMIMSQDNKYADDSIVNQFFGSVRFLE